MGEASSPSGPTQPRAHSSEVRPDFRRLNVYSRVSTQTHCLLASKRSEDPALGGVPTAKPDAARGLPRVPVPTEGLPGVGGASPHSSDRLGPLEALASAPLLGWWGLRGVGDDYLDRVTDP